MRLIEPPGGRPWALLSLCASSVLLNIVLIARLTVGSSTSATVEAEVPAEAPVEAAIASVLTDAAPTKPLPEGVEVLSAQVEHSLARTFQAKAGDRADVLAAVTARLFFFDLDLRADLQKGDVVKVAYTWDGALAHIPVAVYESKKLGKSLTAYEFKASNDQFSSWWDESGQEMAFRLVDGPLDNYEQITSLLKDRPKHKGMDFKVPEGTPVKSPKAGRVVRANWNVANNGNCVEVQYADGTLAKFLHLSRTDVKEGQGVGAGAVVGLSGNTGHSTAPHLHYELEKGGKILDPIDYHGVVRRTLPEGDRAAFEAERTRLGSWLTNDT